MLSIFIGLFIFSNNLAIGIELKLPYARFEESQIDQVIFPESKVASNRLNKWISCVVVPDQMINHTSGNFSLIQL